MCLIVVAVGATPHYPFAVAANRDEQHARPSASAAWWTDAPHVLGGRDLKAGGTWLAVDRSGRFAAVTNIRDPGGRPGPKSRGSLVAEFLVRNGAAGAYAARAASEGADFGAFNLLLYDGRELWFASNRAAAAPLGAGLHAFSNAPTGVEWPKVASARAAAERALSRPAVGRKIAPAFAALPPSMAVESLFAMLAERDDSGAREQRYERAHFVVGPVYGTRCSTVVLVDAAGHALFVERSFDAAGRQVGEVRESFAALRAS
jgi:uncharacterized protein with NRDE domain